MTARISAHFLAFVYVLLSYRGVYDFHTWEIDYQIDAV